MALSPDAVATYEEASNIVLSSGKTYEGILHRPTVVS